MTTTDVQGAAIRKLDEVRRLCPEMRLGQLLATVGLLGEDSTGRSLWDIEDEEFAIALERFADDLERRTEADRGVAASPPS